MSLDSTPANTAALRPQSLAVAAKKPSRPRGTSRPQLLTRDELDLRTNAAKFFDRLVRDIEQDLGGRDALSTIERSLIEGFAGAALVLANLNTRLALGERIDLGDHAQVVNALTKIASRLGLQRRSREIGPTLGELLKADIDQTAPP